MGADYRVMIPSFPSPPTPKDIVNHLNRTRKSLPCDDCHQAADSGRTIVDDDDDNGATSDPPHHYGILHNLQETKNLHSIGP